MHKTVYKSTKKLVNNKKMRYNIIEMEQKINEFSHPIRKHWNIENKLHWQINFTFKSDNNTTMNKKSLFNLQIIKKFCLTILN